MASATTMAWGDEAIRDESFVPPPDESDVDAKGVKTVTEYRLRSDGRKERVTRKVKVIRRRRVVTPMMKERAKMFRKLENKFGLATDSTDQSNVTYKGDEVSIELPGMAGKDDNAMLTNLVAAMQRAAAGRAAGTNNFWASKAQQFQEETGGGPDGGAGGEGGAYRPPGARDGPGGGGGRFAERDDSCTLRVTNISTDTKEADLHDLMRPFGHIARVYLAKDHEGYSRGFAFVSFHRRDEAQRAMEKLNGYGYDHLILRVEWARPSTKPAGDGPPGGGGLSGGFTSGYGKALPQGTGK